MAKDEWWLVTHDITAEQIKPKEEEGMSDRRHDRRCGGDLLPFGPYWGFRQSLPMMRLNKPGRVGWLIPPVMAAAALISSCAPLQPTSNAAWPCYGASTCNSSAPPVFYSLSGAEYPRFDPTTGGYTYYAHPPPPAPPRPPIAVNPPQQPDVVIPPSESEGEDTTVPAPRRYYRQPPVIAQPDEPTVDDPPPRPPARPDPSIITPPPSATIRDDCVGWWRVCHFL